MANVNSPPIRPPRKWLTDPEVSDYIQNLNFMIFQLYHRTGGGIDIIGADNAQVAINTGDIAQNVVDIATNTANIATNTAALVNLYLDYVSSSVDYSITAGEYLYASNGITVTLPLSPTDKESIAVHNADGTKITISGNGNNIDGVSSLVTVRKNTSLRMTYYTTGGQWVIT